MKNLFIFLITMILFFACEKPLPEPNTPPFFEKVWKHALDDRELTLHAAPILYEELLIVWPNDFLNLNYDFAFVDKITGERTFEFQHPDRISDVIGVRLHDDLLIVVSEESTYCFDMRTRSILWDLPSTSELHADVYAGPIFEGKLYNIILTSSSQNSLENDILKYNRVNVLTGESEQLYEHKSEKFDWKIAPGGMTIYRDNQGTLQGTFGISYWTETIPPSGTLSDLVSVNLETKEVNWKNVDYSENGGGSGMYINGKIYINTDWSLYCFDAINGQQLWRTEVVDPQPFYIFTGGLVHVNNHFYCLDAFGTLYKIDVNSGKLTKSFYQVAPGDNATPLVNDGKIFYSSFGTQRIHIFDIDKDEFVHHEPYTSFGEDIVYDAEVDLYYTVTDTHLHAFRIND